MILLALLLATLGTADLVRPQDRAATRPQLARAVATGTAVLAFGGWGCGLSVWWVLLGAGLLAGWVISTPRDRTHPWPIVALGGAALAILAGSAHAPVADGWLTSWYDSLRIAALDGVAFERFALAAGCLVFLVESANIIVRMVLAGTDAGVMASEQTLKGGRVLGPIERILIFSMALSGAYVALTAVVAAKGILRFPEISRDVAGRKAEYVLVGSFVSWSIALVFVPLI
ncbi:hypothetical protein C6I20_09980 [Aeromicrobium sp. A1-2]|uniref:hypothetical protein n=1 Tax=Aeromicrobium sp. A1-2 TaxID=2107713 RepID=UPI000E4C2314|nr:hypothetical protein [Aeromicrobium sp. A1-2]AXT85484.1 hypothetical protein C6I20_09980 [Aeromicrobium sp. A1-2]